MSKVAKQIIIILILLLGVSVFFALSALSQKTALEQSTSQLEKELLDSQEREKQYIKKGDDLQKKLTAAQEQEKKLQRRLKELTDQTQVLAEERDDWKSRVDDLRSEQETLLAQLEDLKKQKAEAPTAPEPQPAQPAQPSIVLPDFPDLPAGEMEDRYWAEVLKEKAGLELKMSELQSELSTALIEVEELKKANSDMELEITHLNNEKEEIERKIKYSEDLANTLSIELAREKNDKRYIDERFDFVKEENAQLRAQVKELTASRVSLEKSLTRLREDKEVLERSLAETESVIQNRIDEVLDIKRTLDQRIKSPTSLDMSKQVELPPIIVSAQGTQAPDALAVQQGAAVGINARVLSVNKDSNFVVIDVGDNAGIRIGDTLSVYRGEKYIAGLEVIQVRADISAADIKHANTHIKAGDIVR